MTVATLAVVALVSMALNGLFVALCVFYRSELRTARIRQRMAQSRAVALRRELEASLSWNAELTDAKNAVDQLLAEDPTVQARNGWVTQMARLWNTPTVVPPHERGAQ